MESLGELLSRAVIRGLKEAVGTRKPRGQSAGPRLPPDVVALIKEKRECERRWKTEKSSFADSRTGHPPRSLVVSFQELKSKSDEVRVALEAFSRQKRGPLLRIMKSKSRKAVKQFWQQVTGKSKSSLEIQCLQRKSDGVLIHSSEDIAEEVYLYLQDIFDGVSGEEEQHQRQYELPRQVSHRFLTPGEVQPRLVSADSSESLGSDPRGYLDADFTMEEVRSVLKSMGSGKAAGWDSIPSEVFQKGPQCLLDLLLVLFNRAKNSGSIPSSWKQGRLCLIHKKGPTTDAFNYRPLTILTSMSSIYTKLLNVRLAKVVEHHGLLGEIQHGFRKGRSTADCSFILNTILAKAAAHGDKTHLAFLDLQKAYDTVDRGTLWTKLKGLGFGGRFLASIQSFYHGDFISSSVGGISTKKVFLGRGVRQGCSLSPLLFALYLSSLGHDLARAPQGVKLNKFRVSALFFADDIVLVSRTSQGLKELLALVNKHCGILKMKLSVSKSKVLSGANEDWELSNGDEVLGTLETVLQYKYLGVSCELSPFKGAAAFQKRALRLGNQYRAACLRLARNGADVVDVAMSLWQQVALPSILYGCESIPFTDSTLDALDRQQATVGKFALGLPVSTPNAAVRAILGLRSVREVVYERQMKFIVRVRDQHEDRWSHDAYLAHLDYWPSSFINNFAKLKAEVGMVGSPESLRHIDTVLSHHFLSKLNKDLQGFNLRGLGQVDKLKRLPHVQECEASQVVFRPLPSTSSCHWSIASHFRCFSLHFPLCSYFANFSFYHLL